MKTLIVVTLSAVLMAHSLQSKAGKLKPVTSRFETMNYLDAISEEIGFDRFDEIPYRYWLSLGLSLNAKDRYDLSHKTIVEHIESVSSVIHNYYEKIESDDVERYLLPYHIRHEYNSTTPWHPHLNQLLNKEIEITEQVQSSANTLLKWINANISNTTPKDTYPLTMTADMDPISTLKGMRGSETDIVILACAALRSIGIQSRVVYCNVLRNKNGGKVWLEYRLETGDWIPWMQNHPLPNQHQSDIAKLFAGSLTQVMANPHQPINITETYAPIHNIYFAEINNDFKNDGQSLHVISNNILYPLIGREMERIKRNSYIDSVAKGSYWIGAGNRNLGVALYQLETTHSNMWYTYDIKNQKQSSGYGEVLPEPQTVAQP